MSIEAVEMYRVVCDRCGVSADEGTDYCCWTDAEGAEASMNDDWLSTEGKHYCGDCRFLSRNFRDVP